MTPDALAQIAARVMARPIQDLDPDAVQDRVLLFDLVRQIARSGFQTQNSDEDPVCFYCQNPIRYSVATWEQIEAGAGPRPPPTIAHATDCPALVLDVLMTKDGT